MEEGRLAGCEGKQPFDNKAMALAICSGLRFKANVYRCKFCGLFHIGSTRVKRGRPEWKPKYIKRGKRKK